MRTYTETNFEDHIEERLNRSGYRSLLSADYDKYSCLIRDEALGFIRESQPEEYRKLEYQHGARTAEKLLDRIRRRSSVAARLTFCAKA